MEQINLQKIEKKQRKKQEQAKNKFKNEIKAEVERDRALKELAKIKKQKEIRKQKLERNKEIKKLRKNLKEDITYELMPELRKNVLKEIKKLEKPKKIKEKTGFFNRSADWIKRHAIVKWLSIGMMGYFAIRMLLIFGPMVIGWITGILNVPGASLIAGMGPYGYSKMWGN